MHFRTVWEQLWQKDCTVTSCHCVICIVGEGSCAIRAFCCISSVRLFSNHSLVMSCAVWLFVLHFAPHCERRFRMCCWVLLVFWLRCCYAIGLWSRRGVRVLMATLRQSICQWFRWSTQRPALRRGAPLNISSVLLHLSGISRIRGLGLFTCTGWSATSLVTILSIWDGNVWRMYPKYIWDMFCVGRLLWVWWRARIAWTFGQWLLQFR